MAAGATTLTSKSNTTIGADGLLTTNSSNEAFGDSKEPNPLYEYASFNYLFSLSCLSPDEAKTLVYRRTLAGPFLVNSGSRTDDWAATAFGKFEFFIEDLSIRHVVGFNETTGNTNAAGFSFKIIEPYSMGLFFQAWQAIALRKDYINYLEAIFLLTVEFTGHKDPDNQNIPLDEHRKFYPIRIRIADMEVTKQGSVYNIEAIPVNEYVFEKSVHTLNTALSIKGKTVKDMLKLHPEKSLQAYLKLREEELVKDKIKNVADQYEIVFPDDNAIGESDMGFDEYRDGSSPFAKDNLTYVNGVYKRGNISIDPKETEFRFAVGSDITNVINQVILMSTYGRTALKTIDSLGFINWWRVETEIEYINVDSNLPKDGVKPKKYIYRVRPYEVDSSYFLPPNDRRQGTALDKAAVLKQYNYLYTGKNLDVLDFNISFSAGFYTLSPPEGFKHQGDKVQSRQGSAAQSPENSKKYRKVIQQTDGTPSVTNAELPTQQKFDMLKTNTSSKGGGGYEDQESLAARAFHNAITQQTDMVTMDLTILGDPYYLSDSGMGSYHAKKKSKYLNVDNSMPWDLTEVHILLNFATPVDINTENGLYRFDKVYQCGIFSGLYKVNLVESIFSKGKFTQKLSIMRLRNQDAPAGDGQITVPPDETFLEETAKRYGTNPGSEQTRLLAEADAYFFRD